MTELMSVGSAAKVLDVSKKRVYQLIHSGRLDSLRPSPRSIRISRPSLEKYIQEQIAHEKRELGLDLPPPPKRR